LAPRWKGGVSLKRERLRLGPELKVWRRAVFKRDNYKCQKCENGTPLHAHHIKEFAKYPELRFEVSNGLTVCAGCHGKIHGKDFTNRKRKTCQDCGDPIANKENTGRCRSCGQAEGWRKRKNPVTV